LDSTVAPQIEYNLIERTVERELIPTHRPGDLGWLHERP
jgi:aryl-alcohol dehydrogenase-like predicted oxidoreductase